MIKKEVAKLNTISVYFKSYVACNYANDALLHCYRQSLLVSLMRHVVWQDTLLLTVTASVTNETCCVAGHIVTASHC